MSGGRQIGKSKTRGEEDYRENYVWGRSETNLHLACCCLGGKLTVFLAFETAMVGNTRRNLQ